MNLKTLAFVILLLVVVYSEQFEASKHYRLLVSENNRKFVEDHNSKQRTSYRMRLHPKFSDKTFQEIKAIYLSSNKVNLAAKMLVEKPNKKSLFSSFLFGQNIHVNWTQRGFVTPVTDQGFCGSCYAHTGIADIQSSYLMKGFKVSLSIQQIIDCSSNFYNSGCNGGWMGNVFDFAKINGLTTTQTYPHRKQTLEEGRTGQCDKKRGQFRIKSYAYTSYRLYDCQSLSAMVMKRPVSVGVLVNFPFIFYSSGIFDGCDPIQSVDMNHALLVVGIHKDSSMDYWTCRNSWGLGWGESGHIRIDRYKDYGNQCQICLAPIYSVL